MSHQSPQSHDTIIFHLCRWPDWESALETGEYVGSEAARKDGFLHFSTQDTVKESAHLHMANLPDLYVIATPESSFGKSLKWEYAPTRKTAFPHVYGSVPVSAVLAALPVPLGAEGAYIFPNLSIFNLT